MTNKYNIPKELNMTLAKRNLVDYIWKSANMEGVMVTYPETDAIFNGMNVAGYKVEEIVLINNLKHAWKFVLDYIDYPTDFAFICKVNQLIGANLYYNAGHLRNIPVNIGGTNWKPPMPDVAQIKTDLEKTLTIKNITEKALTTMCFIMRQQMFIDGNKRTATLVANHMLIAHGHGTISIDQAHIQEFSLLTKNYYESGNIEELKLFLYEKCLHGVLLSEDTLEQQQKHEEILATFNH